MLKSYVISFNYSPRPGFLSPVAYRSDEISQSQQYARLTRPILPHEQIEMRIERPQLHILEAAEILHPQRLYVKSVVGQGGSLPNKRRP